MRNASGTRSFDSILRLAEQFVRTVRAETVIVRPSYPHAFYMWGSSIVGKILPNGLRKASQSDSGKIDIAAFDVCTNKLNVQRVSHVKTVCTWRQFSFHRWIQKPHPGAFS